MAFTESQHRLVAAILSEIGSDNWRYVSRRDLRLAVEKYLPGWGIDEDYVPKAGLGDHPLAHLPHIKRGKNLYILKDEDGKRQSFGQSPRGLLLAIYEIAHHNPY